MKPLCTVSMNSDPNSDLKQCTVTKLGCVHSALIQKLGHADTAHTVPKSWAHAAHTTGRSCAHVNLVARAAVHSCACHAYPVATQSPGRDTKWPNNLGQVATSNPSCDLKQADPGRDLKVGSRLRFPCQAPCQVTTSFPGRDLLDDQARSRRQPHVATSLPA